jgi:hypothetical protein
VTLRELLSEIVEVGDPAGIARRVGGCAEQSACEEK